MRINHTQSLTIHPIVSTLLAKCEPQNARGCILYPKDLPLYVWDPRQKSPSRIQRIIWLGSHAEIAGNQTVSASCCNPRCLAIAHLIEVKRRKPAKIPKKLRRERKITAQLNDQQAGILLDAMDELPDPIAATKLVTGHYPSHPDYSAPARKLTGLTIRKTSRAHLVAIERYCLLERACLAYIAANT